MRKGDFTTLGATAHALNEREAHDFYATDPIALEKFLDESGIELNNVWECACGQGHLAEVLKERNLLGKATDLIDRGYGETEVNFYYSSEIWEGDILTNPPYGDALKFCEHALDCVEDGLLCISYSWRGLGTSFHRGYGLWNPYNRYWMGREHRVYE